MNSQNFVKGLVVATALVSPMAFAQSNYPPAFEPQVLYRDADLIAKHANKAAPVAETKPADAIRTAPQAVSASSPVTNSAAKPAAKPEESSNMLLLFAGLAAVGGAFWFTRKGGNQESSVAPANSATSEPISSGVTGVSQYVESLTSGGVETGVSKYIKGLPALVLSQTGVAKYLRSLPPPEVAGPIETGVTKYLKSLPKPPVLPTDETGVAKYLKSL